MGQGLGRGEVLQPEVSEDWQLRKGQLLIRVVGEFEIFASRPGQHGIISGQEAAVFRRFPLCDIQKLTFTIQMSNLCINYLVLQKKLGHTTTYE